LEHVELTQDHRKPAEIFRKNVHRYKRRTLENTGFCLIVADSLTNTRATTVSERHSQTKGVDGMNSCHISKASYAEPT